MGEPLYGTAPFATIWLLLEYDRPWEAKAWPESDVPKAVRTHLDLALSGRPEARLQLIRQRPRLVGGGLNFFIAWSGFQGPQLRQLVLETYEDMLQIDLETLLDGRGTLSDLQPAGPLFLVCTNGKRDPCCAQYGTPTYSALAAEYGPVVWQTIHVGGHRFAANLVCLPEGVCYGRVRPDNAVELAYTHSQGRIELRHYRGRSSFPEPVQAAEAFLRPILGWYGLSDLALETVEEITAQTRRVVFRDRAGDRHTLLVELLPGLYHTRLSCRDSQPGKSDGYRLLEYQRN
jgi:hypothetical protein